MAKKSTKPESIASESALSSIVIPSIRVNGEKHLLEEMIDAGEAPEMRAVGYMRLGGGSNPWVSYMIKIKGDRVLSIEVDEPNTRQVADEATKINFVRNFTDVEAI